MKLYNQGQVFSENGFRRALKGQTIAKILIEFNSSFLNIVENSQTRAQMLDKLFNEMIKSWWE